MSDPATSLSAADLVRRLGQLWRQGERPDVATFLTQLGTPDVEQVVALLRVDQCERWRHGDTVPVEDYLHRYPILATDPEKALELIFGEFFLQEETGDTPDPVGFLKRFPAYADRLRLQLDIHEALAADVPDSGDTQATSWPTLNTAAGPSRPQPSWPAIPGFDIVRELGRGGMGIVYQAWQNSLYRMVALKMILTGPLADAVQQARFRIETEAAGRLQHPNIIQVFDVGTHHGQPFLTMEFVDGGTLHDYLAGKAQPPRAAAQLVETLARAIDYAHRRGIIHRDLKPANILLHTHGSQPVGFGTPKIADFGLAKLTVGGPGQTETSVFVGTPSYMAPEQIDRENRAIGPATDVYAVGAVLYEMLTGQPPFRGAAPLETILQVSTVEPLPPSRLSPGVPDDLETICLKCLHKQPERRYASAEALAEDLRRFLAGEPIQARPVGRWERLVLWGRRRPTLAAALAISAGASFGLLLQGVWSYGKLSQAAERESRQREEAEYGFRQAMRAVDHMLIEVADVDLQDVPHMADKRHKLLLQARDFYTQFLERRGTDPAVRLEAGRVHVRLGDVQEMLGDQAGAETSYQQAIGFLEALVMESPDERENGRELARAHHSLGVLLKRTQPPAAERAFEASLVGRRQLVEADPVHAAYRQDLAATYYQLASLLARLTGRDADAERLYRQALALLEPLADQPDGKPDYARQVARTLNNLGKLLWEKRRAGAEDLVRRAAAIQRRLTEQDPSRPAYRRELARTQQNLAVMLARSDRPSVEQAYREALELLQSLVADFPTVPDYRQELATVLTNLAQLQQQDPGRIADAETGFRRAQEVLSRLVKDHPRQPDYRQKLARVHLNVGVLWTLQGRSANAEPEYRRALELQRELVGRFPDVPLYRNDLICTLDNLARLLLARPEQVGAEEACQLLQQSVDHQQTARPLHADARTVLADDYTLLASTALTLKDHARAAIAAQQLPRLAPEDPVACLRAVRLLVQGSTLARDDPALSPAERARRADNYERQAVELLRQAVTGGFRNAEELRQPVYDPLRRRDDFRTLMRELDEKKA